MKKRNTFLLNKDYQRPVFTSEMTRIESADALLGALALLISTLAIFFVYALVLATAAFAVCAGFILCVVDNLIFRFVLGFRKTWLSPAVEKCTVIAESCSIFLAAENKRRFDEFFVEGDKEPQEKVVNTPQETPS